MVVAIVGILAAIVIPQFSNATNQAKTSMIRSFAKSLVAGVEHVYAESILDEIESGGKAVYPGPDAQLVKDAFASFDDSSWRLACQDCANTSWDHDNNNSTPEEDVPNDYILFQFRDDLDYFAVYAHRDFLPFNEKTSWMVYYKSEKNPISIIEGHQEVPVGWFVIFADGPGQ